MSNQITIEQEFHLDLHRRVAQTSSKKELVELYLGAMRVITIMRNEIQEVGSMLSEFDCSDPLPVDPVDQVGISIEISGELYLKAKEYCNGSGLSWDAMWELTMKTYLEQQTYEP